MTSRQRVLEALNHRQPDRLPVDFGGSAVSSMHVSCVAGLREHFGLEKRPVMVHEPFQMLGWIDPDLAQALALDVQPVFPRGTMFGFNNERWKPWRTPWGQEVLVAGDFNTTAAADGGLVIYPEGDLAAPPSGHMPKGGYFFDSIIRQQPLDEDHLNPDDNLEEFGPVSDDELRHLVSGAAEARKTGRAVSAWFGGMALGDIARVPASQLKHPRGIRDVSGWYMATVEHQDFIHQIFTRQIDIALASLARVHAAVGDLVDVTYVCGTDFGTQSSTFCSTDTFRALYLPYYRRTNDWIHAHTNWTTVKHSCGAVADFVPLFIAAGFDVLNPVQCSAAGMDPRKLKELYGDRITFWGGGVDTQKVLPFGTPAQVRQQVLERCEIFNAGGGFIFNAIHNVQAGTPVANLAAMFDAVREFNGRA